MQANFICTHIFAYILYRYSRYYPYLNYAYIHNPHIIHILSIFSSIYYLYRLSIDYPYMCIYILYDIIFYYYYYYIILCLLLYYIYVIYYRQIIRRLIHHDPRKASRMAPGVSVAPVKRRSFVATWTSVRCAFVWVNHGRIMGKSAINGGLNGEFLYNRYNLWMIYNDLTSWRHWNDGQ